LNLTSVELQQHGISFEEHIASFYLKREMEIKEETDLYISSICTRQAIFRFRTSDSILWYVYIVQEYHPDDVYIYIYIAF
jgi:hypothetical protein